MPKVMRSPEICSQLIVSDLVFASNFPTGKIAGDPIQRKFRGRQVFQQARRRPVLSMAKC